MKRFVYPCARRSSSFYTMHAVDVPEPYEWLENPDEAETKQFVQAQNSLFHNVIGTSPLQPKILEALTKVQNYPRTSAPFPRGDRYFYFHNSGLQNQSVLYSCDSLSATTPPTVFLDPNKLSEDGTTSLGVAAWSEGEQFLAYSLSEKGSDWTRILVLKQNGEPLVEDRVEWVKYSGISWYLDEGFFCVRFPKLDDGKDQGTETDSALNGAVFFHKIGAARGTAEDLIKILEVPEHPKWIPGISVSDCGKYLIATISDGCEPKNLVWIADVPDNFQTTPLEGQKAIHFNKIVDQWNAEYDFLGNDGEEFYFLTTQNAPKKCVIRWNIVTKEQVVLIPEGDHVLSSALLVRNVLFVKYLEDVKDVLYFCNIQADKPQGLVLNKKRINTPIGSIVSLSGRRNKSFVSLKITSFLLPGRSFYFNVEDIELECNENNSSNVAQFLKVFRDDVVDGFDPDLFQAEQVFVPTTDGVKIPMFIMSRKRKEPLLSTATSQLQPKEEETTPTLLYGYGGFNISLTPSFSTSRVVFLSNLGGQVAIANIRGGGEYGQKWHDDGRKTKKQNCFTDFVNCAKYLIEEKYTSKEKLAIMGGSNGGLLVAACANQAPSLFRAVICQVGVLDMFKFHKFTIGHAWRSDFGDPDVEEDFKVLQTYSPLHNLPSHQSAFPAVLVVTGDHDDRVVPLHSLKYIASLQHFASTVEENATSSLGPFLARVEVAAGHGAGKPITKILAESADTYTFLSVMLNAHWSD